MNEAQETLKLYAETSDAPLNRALVSSLRTLRTHMDRVARDLAKSRDEWMDDPEDERYEHWHSSAGVQFDQPCRLEVLRALLNHQIDELLIQEEVCSVWCSLSNPEIRDRIRLVESRPVDQSPGIDLRPQPD